MILAQFHLAQLALCLLVPLRLSLALALQSTAPPWPLALVYLTRAASYASYLALTCLALALLHLARLPSEYPSLEGSYSSDLLFPFPLLWPVWLTLWPRASVGLP